MTREEIDTMWQQALHDSVKDGEMFTRYHFAKLVAAKEREACAKVCEEVGEHPSLTPLHCAESIRERGYLL